MTPATVRIFPYIPSLSLQGFFIFVLNCLRQQRLRSTWWIPFVSLICCRK